MNSDYTLPAFKVVSLLTRKRLPIVHLHVQSLTSVAAAIACSLNRQHESTGSICAVLVVKTQRARESESEREQERERAREIQCESERGSGKERESKPIVSILWTQTRLLRKCERETDSESKRERNSIVGRLWTRHDRERAREILCEGVRECARDRRGQGESKPIVGRLWTPHDRE